jgi:hypothetical protein
MTKREKQEALRAIYGIPKPTQDDVDELRELLRESEAEKEEE